MSPLVVAVGLTSSWAARAQDVPAAAAAFDNGLADMEAGRYETGCPALAESFKLDPRPGVLFTEAECEARWGKIATAFAHYADFLQLVARLPPDQQAKHLDRQKIAEEQKAALATQVPRLRLVLPPSAPAGTLVSKDGVALGAASLGVWLPVDPGGHVVTSQTPGTPAREIRVELLAGGSKEIVLDAPPAPPVVGAPSAIPAGPTVDPGPPMPRRLLVYVTGGIGVTGIAVGAVTGALALGKKGTVDDNCEGPACNPAGFAAADSGQTLALVSTIGFGVGIVGVGAAVVLLLTEPKRAASAAGRERAWRPMAWADPTRAQAGLRARW